MYSYLLLAAGLSTCVWKIITHPLTSDLNWKDAFLYVSLFANRRVRAARKLLLPAERDGRQPGTEPNSPRERVTSCGLWHPTHFANNTVALPEDLLLHQFIVPYSYDGDIYLYMWQQGQRIYPDYSNIQKQKVIMSAEIAYVDSDADDGFDVTALLNAFAGPKSNMHSELSGPFLLKWLTDALLTTDRFAEWFDRSRKVCLKLRFKTDILHVHRQLCFDDPASVLVLNEPAVE